MPARKFDKIYLHIGLHKTGSTTIQHALHAGKKELSEQLGILYPGFKRNHSTALVAMFHHAPETYRRNVMDGIDTPAAAAKHADACRQLFESEMTAHGGDTLFLSGEDVSDLRPEGIAKLREWLMGWTDNPHILCVVRDPVKWSVSAAQSNIRGGRTWEDVNREVPLLEASRRLGKFLEAFGRDNMTVLRLESARDHPGGLANFVLGHLGFTGVDLLGDAEVNQNVSMSLEAAHIISQINRLYPLFIDGKMNPERYLNDVVPIIRGVPGTRFRLDKPTMDRIRESAARDSSWLKEHFDLELPIEEAEEGDSDVDGAVPFSPQALESLAEQLQELSRFRREPKMHKARVLARRLRGKPID